jgi:hypothetical protein
LSGIIGNRPIDGGDAGATDRIGAGLQGAITGTVAVKG